MSASPTTGAPTGRLPIGADVWRVAIVVILGMIMSVLDTTIVNVALESLSKNLNSSLDNVQWVVTGYLLSLAAVIPISGWAARRYGAKRVYLVSIIVFTAGSALCGLATNISELIAFRVVQGIGGGMIMPIGQLLLVRKAGPQRLARVMSAIGIPVILSPVFGPTIGGLLIDSAGWRWIFYVNVPVGIAAVIASLRLLPVDPHEEAGPLDVAGLILSAGGLVALTYGLAEIGEVGTFQNVHVIAPIAAGVVMLAVFVLRSLRIARPLLDLRLYKNRAFSAASLTTGSLGAALFGGMILMPLYFQTVRHEDPLLTGMLVGPQGMGAAVAMWIAGRSVDRFGAGVTAFVGGVVCSVFTIPFVLIGAHTSYLLLDLAMVGRGLGIGLATMPSMTAAYRILKPSQIGDATPQLNVVQRIGASIGTAILTVILQRRLVSAGSSLPAQASAFGTTFWWVFAITALATAPTLLMIHTERRLRADARAVDAEGPPVPGAATEPPIAVEAL